MVAKKYILENLNQLDRAFRSERDAKRALYFSKLAILELCGWIELSMDEMVISHCARKVKVQANTKLVEDNVKRTFGFDYEKHFRKMLINLIGVVMCEKLEAQLDASTHTLFLAQLRSLKQVRDRLAHTYMKGTMPLGAIDAPSVTKARLIEVYDGLKGFEKILRSL